MCYESCYIQICRRKVGSQFGLTVSIPNTKDLAMRAVSVGDVSAMEVGNRTIEMVEGFTYLCSNLSVDCEIICEIKCEVSDCQSI